MGSEIGGRSGGGVLDITGGCERGCSLGLEVHIMLLIGLDNLLDMLASYSPDPKLDTVVEGGDLARLEED